MAKRNKSKFAAQEMLVLLAQLAHNLVIWTRNALARAAPCLAHYGIQRMVRDVLRIPGQVRFDAVGKVQITRAIFFPETKNCIAFGLYKGQATTYTDCQVPGIRAWHNNLHGGRMKTKSLASLFAVAFVLGALLFAFSQANSIPSAQAQEGGGKKKKPVPTVTKKLNSALIDGLSASASPKKNKLLALDANAKFPESVIPDAIQRRVNGECAEGSSIRVINTDGSVMCQAKDASSLAGPGWELAGNAATNPLTNFLGTTDANALVFRTNNAEQVRIQPNGNVGIGTANPAAKLQVKGLAEGLRLEGTAGGAANVAYASFFDNANVRTGWVGDGSDGTFDIVLASSNGGLSLRSKYGDRIIAGADGITRILATPVGNSGEALRLQGLGSGGGNRAFVSFYDNAGTRIGVVGDANINETATALTSDYGAAQLAGCERCAKVALVTAGANGNVGIGTSTPGNNTLDVIGGAAFQGNHIYIRNLSPVVPAGKQTWGIAVDGNGKFVIGQSSLDVPPGNLSLKSAPIQIEAGAPSSSVYINPGGFVGIGRNSPQARLHINGGVRVDAGAAGSGIRLGGNAPGATSTVVTTFYDNANKRIGFVGDADSSNIDTTLGSDAGAVVLRANASGNYYQLKLGTDGTVSVPVLQIMGGADLAENFHATDSVKPEPGTVMVIDEVNEGKLKTSTTAYDKKVVGIVSGAGSVKTGMTLQQTGVLDGDLPVTVVGRVYCKAEAVNGAIQPGDLLTTSTIAGHCMKASDNARSNGAIIGKAMTGLKSGKGLVLVLVNLQ